MRFSTLRTAAVTTTLLALYPACGASTPPTTNQYEAYDCPAPVGRIVREDCSRSALRWEGMQAEGKLGIGPVGASAAYKEQAIREADDLITMLKEQRSSLCQDFNTCKLTVAQYRFDKERIESTATAVLAIRGNVEKISSGDVMAYLEEIRKIRTGGPSSPTPSIPAPHEAHEPSTAPTPAPAGGAPEWGPGKGMLQATALVADAAFALEQKTKFGFDVDHGCILGASVGVGEIITLSQTMKAGREYAILGGGAHGTQDIDIAVFDMAGKQLAADTDDDATPAVSFKVPKDAVYKVKLQLAKTEGGGGAFVAMAVMHEGGYSIPTERIIESFRAVAATAAEASAKVATRGAKGLIFHEENSWSFYSTVLKPGERSGMGDISFKTDPSVIVAGADTKGTNIDLHVVDGADAVVGKDEDPDAQPIVLVHPDPGKKYGFRVANASTTGTTLATVVVLDVQH